MLDLAVLILSLCQPTTICTQKTHAVGFQFGPVSIVQTLHLDPILNIDEQLRQKRLDLTNHIASLIKQERHWQKQGTAFPIRRISTTVRTLAKHLDKILENPARIKRLPIESPLFYFQQGVDVKFNKYSQLLVLNILHNFLSYTSELHDWFRKNLEAGESSTLDSDEEDGVLLEVAKIYVEKRLTQKIPLSTIEISELPQDAQEYLLPILEDTEGMPHSPDEEIDSRAEASHAIFYFISGTTSYYFNPKGRRVNKKTP